MTTLATILAGLASLAILQLRPATRASRTWSEIRTAVRTAGWPRVTARTLQIAVVSALMCLGGSLWIAVTLARWAGTALVVIAAGIAALGPGPELIAGHA